MQIPDDLGRLVIPEVEAVSVDDLGRRLNFDNDLAYPATSRDKPLNAWRMEDDDSPIFRYLYRNFRPDRHLEFGTWEGTGTLYCLEESDATVWTLNLREGEDREDGKWAYGELLSDDEVPTRWAEAQSSSEDGKSWYRTDALGCIGRRIHARKFGHRVCQIYCDSRNWDTSRYPVDFFDTVLIDGGHQPDVVESDTDKALSVTRPGGLVLWHDFCPREEVFRAFPSVRGVSRAIAAKLETLRQECSDLFWIDPSFILLGRRG